ncbi:hypothetical protein [Acidisoma cladoniae]|jgi:hypothetical protein|uniref:hypothetical protein n=1 Tax=Acidisoma cladoniae TaxID=3040935 RepID=UPI00254C12E0|nr:hypothetical protein [Acidisoma sp. PAMC 29798]
MADRAHTTGGGTALTPPPLISNPTSTLSTDQPFSRRVDRLLFTESVNEWIELILAGAADATDDEIAPHLAAGLAAPLAASRVLAGRVVAK